MAKNTIIVIPASDQESANGLAKQTDTLAGEYTFTVGLSSDGFLPATHYWCSWVVAEAQKTTLSASTRFGDGNAKGRLMFDGSSTPDEVLKELGLQRIILKRGL